MNTFRTGVVFTVGTLLLCGVAFFSVNAMKPKELSVSLVPESHSAEYQKAFFAASKAYGHAGCGSQELAEMTAQRSVETGLPAELIAGQVATESTCNPLAISNRGAIGLMQVVPKVWSKSYDFSKINLFNPRDNMIVGTTILADLVKKYGVKKALLHYYGTGNDGIGMGGSAYAAKVIISAGVK